MSDHFTTHQLEGYQQRTVEPMELLALDTHLAECAACRRQLRAVVPARSALLALETNLQNAASSPVGFGTRLTTLFSAQDWTFSQVLGGAGVLTLLILALMLWLRGQGEKDGIVNAPSPVTPSPTSTTLPTPSPRTPILLTLKDGGEQVTLDAQGGLTGLAMLAPTEQQRVIKALQTGKVETPSSLTDLRPSSGTLMGAGAEQNFTLIGPIGKVILSRRPILRWQPLPGATSYTVTITDPQNNYQPVAFSPPLTATEWEVQQPLPGGRTYAWVVVAEKDGQKITAPSAAAGEVKFNVLEQAKADELARAEKRYARMHLLMGLLYAQAGLLEESEREFQSLVAANPQSPVAKALLRDVQTRRR